jgi:hypothetical protein
MGWDGCGDEDGRGAARVIRRDERPWRPDFRGVLRMRRAGEREALLLTLVCALDMFTTLYWVVTGHATEANGGLAWTFHYHPIWFVLVKSASCFPALLFATRLARRRPRFTAWLLRAILAAYVTFYCANVA